MATALMILSKSFYDDPRVTREAESLAEAGNPVAIFSWNRERSVIGNPKMDERIRVFMMGPSCPKRRPINFILRLPLFWLSCLLQSRKVESYLVHAHDFDTILIGFLISRLKQNHLFYDAHESYADMISDDVPKPLMNFIRFIEKMLVKRTDVVIVANKKISSLIGARYPLVVLNCPSKSEVPSCTGQVSECADGRSMRIGYFGSLEPGRFIRETIEVISHQDYWKLVIAGAGRLEREVKEAAEYSNAVEYLGIIPHEEVMRLTMTCDAIIVMFDPSNTNNRIGTPNRLFEAMSVGTPVIVTKDTYSAEITLSENCGFVCDYDESSLSKLLNYLSSSDELSVKGKSGIDAFRREYNWEKQASELVHAYHELTDK